MANTYTNLVYHIVFSTKHREPLITNDLREELYKYIGGIFRAEGGALLKIGGTPDHVHLLVKLKAAHSVSEIMRKVKANSSKWINENKKTMGRFSWQTGYGAFSVSESRVGAVIDYINTQEDHHREKSFQEEFLQLLKKHGIEYDDRYLWQ